MAKEITRRFIPSTRTVVVDVEDAFGHVTPHTIPLTGDHCPHCGSAIHDGGSRDIEASAAIAVQSVHQWTEDILPVLEAAGVDVAAAKAKHHGDQSASKS